MTLLVLYALGFVIVSFVGGVLAAQEPRWLGQQNDALVMAIVVAIFWPVVLIGWAGLTLGRRLTRSR